MSSASRAQIPLISTQSSVIDLEVGLAARDKLQLRLEVDENQQILSSRLVGVGCPEVLNLMQLWRPKLTGGLQEIELPDGTSHGVLLLREILLKAQGRWDPPYKDEEICHCRVVATRKVEDAIIAGCHTVDRIKRATNASTSCGTCRPDLESLLAYRLGSAFIRK
jgi:NAD(P)H-nitrite reductase large subunit